MRFLSITLGFVLVLHSGLVTADAPNVLKLSLRNCVAKPDGSYETVVRGEAWDPHKSAIIVCDMWDLHHCLNAVRRVGEMAPRMNQVLAKARDRGVLIIHAPSSCMDTYKDHPARKRAQSAPQAANLPKDIAQWCRHIPAEDKGVYPIDQTHGGEDDDLAEHADWHKKLAAMGRNPKAPWKSQIDVLTMDDRDAISDSGVEIWNLLTERGIDNVILLGVHTNMCVLGRPFGLRQMAKNGKNVVLMRDMTDTMYDPQRWPYVSHFHGTDLIVEHIEKFVCATITSDQLIGGEPFKFKGDMRPRVVIAIAEGEYDTKTTLPVFARKVLEDRLGLETTVLQGSPTAMTIPGLADALPKADLLLISIRRVALPEQDLQAIRKYLDSGKPLMGIRTASHAFDAKGKHPKGHVEWPKFDPEVLGGNYQNHYPVGPATIARVAPGAEKNPLLVNISLPFTSKASLYKTSPLVSSAVPLLVGLIPDRKPEPIAWTHMYKKSRVFYTSLGHRDDFETPQFLQLMENGARWCVGMALVEGAKR